MTQITVHQPSRGEMRMLFEHAIGSARTEGAKAEFGKIAAYHELRWQAEDQANAAAREQAAQEAAAKVAGQKSPAPPPAVVEHGINSPQAQAKRDVRAATRKANEANNQKAAMANDGTLPG